VGAMACTRRSAGRGWLSRKSTPNCRGPTAPTAIDMLAPAAAPLIELPVWSMEQIDRAIADHVARLIPDRVTIELGLGAIPQAVTRALGRKRAIGVHSGAIGDGIADLMEAGIVDNRHTEIDLSVTVTTMLTGTLRLYRFAERNPAIQIRRRRIPMTRWCSAISAALSRSMARSRSTSPVRSTPRPHGEDISVLSAAKWILSVPQPRHGGALDHRAANRPIANAPVRA